MLKNWVPVAEAAERFELKSSMIRKLAQRGTIKARKYPGLWLIDIRSLESYINEGYRKPGPKPKHVDK